MAVNIDEVLNRTAFDEPRRRAPVQLPGDAEGPKVDAVLGRTNFGPEVDPVLPALSHGVRENPDELAEANRLAEETGLPLSVVRANPFDAKVNKRMRELDPVNLRETNPKTAEWLSNPYYAAVAHDDVETLKAIESSVSEYSQRNGYLENMVRGWGKTLSSDVGMGIAQQLTFWNDYLINRPLYSAYDFLKELVTDEEGTALQKSQDSYQAIQNVLQKRKEYNRAFYGYESRGDIDAVFEDPSVANIAHFIKEEGPQAIPWLLTASLGTPTITAAITELIAEDRARNEGREGEVLDLDRYIALPWATVAGAAERFGFSKLMPKGKKGTVQTPGSRLGYTSKEAGKGLLTETLTEGFQGGMEYLGGSLGTEAGFDPEEFAKSVVAEGLAGGPVGGAMRAATASAEYNGRVAHAAMEGAARRIRSEHAQSYLDNMVFMAQESSTGARAPEDFAAFIDTVDPDSVVYVDPEVAAGITDAPDYITDQLDGTGTEVQISMRDLLKDFARDETWMPYLRPHLRIGEDVATLQELENAAPDPHVQKLIKQAQAREETYNESEQYFNQIVEGIVGTNRQGEATARQSAEVIRAYAVTKYHELKKKKPDITLANVIEDMGFNVIGPEQKPGGAGVELDPDVEAPQDPEYFNQMAEAPRKTVKAYKMFRVDPKHPGKLFPLFVNANEAVPIGQWVRAESGPLESGKVKSKIGKLAYRPGWHAGDLPIAKHIGGKSQGKGQKKPDYRPAFHVWAEVEMPADVDWQTEANARASRSKKGDIVPRTAHITDQIPAGGHYRYKTNPNMEGEWLIGGEMKVTRVLSDEEVTSINSAAGTADLPRLEGERAPTEAFSEYLSQSQDFGDATLSDTYQDEAGNPQTFERKAQEDWELAQQRLTMVDKLRECMNG